MKTIGKKRKCLSNNMLLIYCNNQKVNFNISLTCPFINQDTHFVVNEKDDIIDDIYTVVVKTLHALVYHEKNIYKKMYITPVFSSNEFYNSHFSVMERVEHTLSQ